MRVCPDCGHVNGDNNSFCTQCGTSLPAPEPMDLFSESKRDNSTGSASGSDTHVNPGTNSGRLFGSGMYGNPVTNTGRLPGSDVYGYPGANTGRAPGIAGYTDGGNTGRGSSDTVFGSSRTNPDRSSTAGGNVIIGSEYHSGAGAPGYKPQREDAQPKNDGAMRNPQPTGTRTPVQHGSNPIGTALVMPSVADAPSIGFTILGFFLPLVGIILHFVWRKKTPHKAASVGNGAALRFMVKYALQILTVVISIVAIIVLLISGNSLAEIFEDLFYEIYYSF